MNALVRASMLWIVGAAACAAQNPEFLGPGFDDPVELGVVHPVWEERPASSAWSVGACDPDEGESDGNWRLGVADDCERLGFGVFARAGSVSGLLLATKPIPVGRRVTLSMRTRVSLPACGSVAFGGGRVDATGDDFSRTLEFDQGQLPALIDARQVFAGTVEWTEVESTFDLPELDELVITFGFLPSYGDCLRPFESGSVCELEPDAAPGCEAVRTCCEAAAAALPQPTGWQIDDVRLRVEP